MTVRGSILLRTFRRRWLVALAAGGAAFGVSDEARAQNDVQRALPNVLVLLDNSGSMERMIDGSLPEANAGGATNACTPGTASNPNRWGVALQALTGEILPSYQCYAEPRDGATNAPVPTGATYTPSIPFLSEYQIGGQPPYDRNYFLPFHRPIFTGSNQKKYCSYGPNRLPGANSGASGVGPNASGWTTNGYTVGGGAPGAIATDFPSDALWFGGIGSREAAAACSDADVQRNNGALDGVAYDTIRFGFMTFDVDTLAGTGATTGGSPVVTNTTTSAFDGMWSYFPGWDGNGGSSPASGNPQGCSSQIFEVGARNPAAPPWEGRFIRFPSPSAQTTDLHANNDQIQKVINSLRPYGATPVAGLLQDAEWYFWKDPNGPNASAANPSYDAFAAQGCRNQYIILLTDGAPNLDLRNNGGPGSCAGSSSCPYKLPEQITQDLATGNGGPKVVTYVIGFATSSVNDNGQLVQCQSLVSNGQLASVCQQNPVPSNYQACCELDKIAFNGGSGSAYFADTPGSLVLALSDIFARIGAQTTTRTTPAFSPVVTSANYDPNSGAQALPSSSVYLSAFYPNVGRPWSGDIQRQTQQCQAQGTSFTVKTPNPTISNGDDFAANLNSHAGDPRHFLAVYPGAAGQTIVPGINDATTTIRPYITGAPKDGLGTYGGSASFGGTQYGPTVSSVITGVKPDALGLPPTASYSYATAPSACRSSTPGNYLTRDDCAALAWNFLLGSQSTPTLRTQPANQPPLGADGNGFMPFSSRYCTSNCATTTPNASALGAIYHATPTVVGPPSPASRDESYRLFASTLTYSSRKTVVYSATTDGLLHAFSSDVTQNVNNEMWAFAPPAVMPGILGSYPASPSVLLDGSPIVMDVVWDRVNSNPGSGTAPVANAYDWHTMLVASYGPQARGFYALDVSNPDPTNIPSTSYNSAPAGPVFRWSITRAGFDASNNPYFDLFGQHSSNPTVTTIFVDPTDSGATPHEVGVAILPGGWDSPATTGAPSPAGPGGSSCARAYTSSPGVYGNLPLPLANGANTFKPRSAVRCWGANKNANDAVVGRTLSIVRVDTGEVLRVFARASDFPSNHPLVTATPKRIKDTPFDSPITGTPIAYPNQIGAIASKVFVSDADGTIWRIDLSDPQPKNWKASLFLDTMNESVPGFDSTKAWYQGQPVQVPPVLSLDRSGQLVLNIATGDQDTYTPSGTNYVYSITERLDTASASLRPYVNWYTQLTNGERVSGPMTVFDSALYFATFSPATGNTQCSIGNPYIWGMDFTAPKDSSSPQNGGNPLLNSGGTCVGAGSFPCQKVDPSSPGFIIPGVTINQTPACAGASAPGFDGYVGGAMHESLNGVMGSTFSLFYQRGGNNSISGGPLSNPGSISLNQPRGATIVDSWAAIVE